MSVATYITSLESSRNTIRNKLIELGMATSSDKLEKLADTIEGIVNQGAVSITVMEGDTYTIPKGYHNGNGTVSGIKGGGDYTLQAKTATPTKKQQNITPDNGFYGLSGVTVAAIPEAYQDVTSVTAGAEDVLTGKVFVTKDGVVTAGEMLNHGAANKTLDAVTVTYSIPKGYHNGSGVVKLVLETKSVTPTKATQEITPSNGKVLSKVTVDPIPDAYQDVTGVTATADKVLTGSKFVDAEGNSVDGTMADNSKLSITPLSVERKTFAVPKGYYNGETTISVAGGGTAYATPSKDRQVIEGSYVDNGAGNLVDHAFLGMVIVEPIPEKYQDVSGVDAGTFDVLEGKKYVNKNGTLITGTMPNNGGVTGSIDGLCTNEYIIPEGYHNGVGKISLTNDIENALKAI